MPIITLPDGNNLSFPDKVTGLDVAEKISKSLAKQAMVISVDGDLSRLIVIASVPVDRKFCHLHDLNCIILPLNSEPLYTESLVQVLTYLFPSQFQRLQHKNPEGS